MKCFVCIHCHFYQPPRENPWLEMVEAQESARPYHDWNERITAECYRPNGASRILDGQGRIAKIVNNYARISFNFGPTLLSWMQEQAPQTYEHILQADRESQLRFSGHGSALAQAYNHAILPLANSRDKQTQIGWGVADFQHRFGRDPEGMWLPETAVDTETLEMLSAAGIKFTILSPYQAAKKRHDSKAEWVDLHGHGIDPKRPYVCRLPSGRSIGIFFYDGEMAQAVAFDKLLFDGAALAERLAGRFDEHGDPTQLVHIATDGETYGHHHSHGDMALAYALDYIERDKLATLTNYGEYFAKHPPTQEVEIRERTSWSCAHGVSRWESNCGCNSTLHPGWHQEWRRPLRETLNWLRDSLRDPFEREARKLLKEPWGARNAYIQVVLDRSPESFDNFITQHGKRTLSNDEKIQVWRLLEMQRQLMLMYTSCGWFFDELSGPETVQILRYAGRAAQIGEQLFGDPLEEPLLEKLGRARSNLYELSNGQKIYEQFVIPGMLDMFDAAAHYVISSLFDGYVKRESIYCYGAQLRDAQVFAEGRKKLAIGQASLTSRSTGAQMDFDFAVLCQGDHRLIAGISLSDEQGAFTAFTQQASTVFEEGNLAKCWGLLEYYFGKRTYSLGSLFYDEQQRIISQLIDASLEEIDGVSRGLHEKHAPQISFLSEHNVPVPTIFKTMGQFVLGNAIRRALADERPNYEHIRELLHIAKRDGVTITDSSLNPALKQRLETLLKRWRQKPDDLATLRALEGLVLLAHMTPFSVDVWEVQNQYYEVMQAISSGAAFHLDAAWLHHFYRLGDELGVAPAQPFETVLAHSASANDEIAPKAKDSSRSTRPAGPSERAQLPI